MKRLKELRQSARYSQKQLAEMLETTQQTIARWETGAVEPSLKKLRDLALIFGVGVDDLVGASPVPGPTPTTSYHLLSDGVTDGFWGHVGLLLDSRSQTSWFPVTARTVNQITVDLGGDDEWIAFPTLANKLVAFRPSTVRKIWILDDAADGPAGDWTLELPYEGLPIEIYRAFGSLGETRYDKADWEKAVAHLPHRDAKGQVQPGQPELWKLFSDELAESCFDGEASDAFLGLVAKAFVDAGLHDPDAYYRLLHYTQVHLVGGEEHAFWSEEESLTALLLDVDMEAVPRLIHFEHFGGAAETYFPSGMVSAVLMPMVDVLDAQRDEAAREEADLTNE